MSEAFPIPPGVLAHHVHKAEAGGDGVAGVSGAERIEWRDEIAWWTKDEQQLVRGLASSEVALIHAFKAVFDAVLMEGEPGAGSSDGEKPSSPSTSTAVSPSTSPPDRY